MALEVVSGPSPVSVDGTPVATFNGGTSTMFIQGLGLLATSFLPTGGSFGTYAVQLDGTAQQRSEFAGASIAGLLLDLRASRGLVAQGIATYFNFNWLAARPDETPFLTLGAGVGTVHVVCTDRFLRISSNQVLSSPLTDGATFTLEYTFTGTSPSGTVTVSRGGDDNTICIAWGSGSGQIRFYDVVRKTQVGSVLYVGETHQGVWYVPKHDIFIELKTLQLKILANAVRPASLSNPAAISTVAAGKVATIRTQLLGAQGEPCVGELVDWLITAGGGSLTAVQSTTDAAGYATTGFIGPVGSSGSVSIQAAVNF